MLKILTQEELDALLEDDTLEIKMPIALTEETSKDIIEEWRKEATKVTLKTLPVFLDKLMNDYKHDYGTICHAISIGSIATMWAMNNEEQGGITGFQAGIIMWENIRNWQTELRDVPIKLVTYEDMLYPQYENKFEKTISKSTWEWLQLKAQEAIDRGAVNAHPSVYEHWKSIVNGKVPFGYIVED